MLPFEPFTVQALGSPEVFQPDENRKEHRFRTAGFLVTSRPTMKTYVGSAKMRPGSR